MKIDGEYVNNLRFADYYYYYYYYYYKRSLITINLINCTIYLPKGREFKKNKTYIQYTIEIKK